MDEDIEDLKQKKMEQLKEQMDQEQQEEKRRKEMEKQKKQLLRQILTTEARSRLSNLRMAKPEFTERIELQLIQLAKSGRLDLPITDEQLKNLLKKLQSDKKSINIERR